MTLEFTIKYPTLTEKNSDKGQSSAKLFEQRPREKEVMGVEDGSEPRAAIWGVFVLVFCLHGALLSNNGLIQNPYKGTRGSKQGEHSRHVQTVDQIDLNGRYVRFCFLLILSHTQKER